MKILNVMAIILLVAGSSTAIAQVNPTPPNPDAKIASAVKLKSKDLIFQNALDRMGGEEKLNGLVGLSVETSGTVYADDEGFRPNEFIILNEFVETISNDISNNQFHISAKLNLLYEAAVGKVLNYHEIIHANAGVRSDGSTIFDDGSAKYYPVSAGYLGAIQRQNRLLNPHFFLLQGLSTPDDISTHGKENLDGQIYDILVIKDSIQDIKLYVHSVTGEIKKLETMEVGNFRRDVPIRVEYSDWRKIDGLSFPYSVSIYFDGFLTRKATRKNIVLNQTFKDNLFYLPKTVTRSFSESEISTGAKNRQTPLTFRGVSISPGWAFTIMPIQASKLSDGVHYLGGGATSSIAIEQSDYVILIEAPLSDERALLIIDWVKNTFNNKPIKYLVPTHHHQDHSAGVRTIMAGGDVTLVVADSTVDFFKNNILSASSIIEPDALELNPLAEEPSITAVDRNANITLGDANKVIIHRIKSRHADDMIIASITSGTDTIIFTADMYNVAFMTLAAEGPRNFITKLQELGFIDSTTCQATRGTTVTITTGHSGGVSEPIATTISSLIAQGRDIPCQI